MHDPDLLRQARLGDQQATAQLLDGYRNYIQLLAQIQTRKGYQAKSDASDLVQETCLAVCRDIKKFRGQTEQEFLAWLRRIMANRGGKMDRHFKAQRRNIQREQNWGADLDRSAASLSRLASPLSTPSRGVARREAAVILADKLAELPDHYRDAIVLHYFEGLKIAEVSQQLGRTPEATNSLLARALIKLRSLMKGVE